MNSSLNERCMEKLKNVKTHKMCYMKVNYICYSNDPKYNEYYSNEQSHSSDTSID